MHGGWENIIGGCLASERSQKDMTMVKRKCITTPWKRALKFKDKKERIEKGKVDSGQGLLKTYSLPQWSSFV